MKAAMTHRVALIGYGAIGRTVARELAHDTAVTVSQVLVRPGREPAACEALGRGIEIVSSVDALAPDLALVVECAGQVALAEHGAAVLRRGLDLAMISTGALTDPGLERALKEAARQSGARARILSGAIGGMDALAAAREAGLERVVYQSRKPPSSWRGTVAEDRFDLDAIDRETVVFEGSAREAARLFPKNANVAATVALAGLGFERTTARLVADPGSNANIHLIEASGRAGTMSFELNGLPLPDNPRTSMLTSYSVIAAIRSLAAEIEGAAPR